MQTLASHANHEMLGLVPFPPKLESMGVRLMRAEELSEVLEIHDEVWGTEVTQRLSRRWNWLQDRNPFRTEAETVVPVLREKGQIQAFIVHLPHTFRVYGRPWRVYMGGHLTGRTVRPAAALRLNQALISNWPVARWGLISHTFRLIRGVLRRHDYRTRPNSPFTPQGEGLTVEQQNRTPFLYWPWNAPLVRPVRTAPYIPNRLVSTATDKVLDVVDRIWLERKDDPSVRELERFPDELDPWLEEVMETYPMLLERTVRYLNWRYYEFEDIRYRRFLFEDRSGVPVGYAVVEPTIGSKGYPIWAIADLFAPKGDLHTVAGMMRRLVRLCRTSGATAIRTRDGGDDQMSEIHRAMGFRCRGEDDRYLTLFRTPMHADVHDLAKRTNFYVCSGDGDARVV